MILFGFRKREAVVPRELAHEAEAVAVKSVAQSETGLVRADNQDHLFVDDARLVYCVADGVGGGAEGARASEIVCANLKMVTYAAADTFKARTSAVQKAIEDANAALFAYAREKGVPLVASTVAALVLDPENPRHAAICNVGDSRIYRFRRGMPELLTHDHRLGGGSHALTRAIGAAETVRVEWTELESTDASRFLLCTDGVHDVVSAGRLAAFVSAAPTLDAAVERIAADVVRHGAPDNYSFVLLEV